jgi:hypothetical protein
MLTSLPVSTSALNKSNVNNILSDNIYDVRIVQEKKMSQLNKLSLRCVTLSLTVKANMVLCLTVFEAETK